jgi:sugar/nucleoside kinase (ribokinase family)
VVLTGSGADDPPPAVAGRLRELLRSAARPRLGLLTLGSEGALLVDVEAEPLLLPAPRRVDGDPTGAGDTLGAAFMAGWMASMPPVAALRAAMQAAATACARSGCDGPGQDANDLDVDG